MVVLIFLIKPEAAWPELQGTDMLIIAVIVYAIAMILANLLIAVFGPTLAPFNSFVLIGLDLALRDWLHVRLKPLNMLCLIVGTGCATYLLNPTAGAIAIASALAFNFAAIADWVTFARLRGSWLFRANGSNCVGAFVDSIVFLLLVPFPFSWAIAMQMIVVKIAGGAFWSRLIFSFVR